jgi:hypothetical protein
MVVLGNDMAEILDEILRAPADPERLLVAGSLARADAGSRELAGGGFLDRDHGAYRRADGRIVV